MSASIIDEKNTIISRAVQANEDKNNPKRTKKGESENQLGKKLKLEKEGKEFLAPRWVHKKAVEMVIVFGIVFIETDQMQQHRHSNDKTLNRKQRKAKQTPFL